MRAGRALVATAASIGCVLVLSGCTAQSEPGYMWVTGDPENSLTVMVKICERGWLPWATVIGPKVAEEYVRLDYRQTRDALGPERLVTMSINNDDLVAGTVIEGVLPETAWRPMSTDISGVETVAVTVSGGPAGGFASDFDLSELAGSGGDGWLVHGATYTDEHSVSRMDEATALSTMANWCVARGDDAW